jgi:hypothetical protein
MMKLIFSVLASALVIAGSLSVGAFLARHSKPIPLGDYTLTPDPFIPPFHTLKIGAFTYKVIWHAGAFTCSMDATIAIGCTDPTKLEITIDDTVEGPALQAVVLHEAMHAIFNLHGNSMEAKRYSDEEIAEFAPLYIMLLKENPQLTRFITQ